MKKFIKHVFLWIVGSVIGIGSLMGLDATLKVKELEVKVQIQVEQIGTLQRQMTIVIDEVGAAERIKREVMP